MAGYSIVQICIAIVVIAAVVALMYVALRQFGVAIPAWAVTAFWIVVVAVGIIFAIKLVASMMLLAPITLKFRRWKWNER